jgi:acetyl-CoA carboxylase biotin carboxyl carrier protein
MELKQIKELMAAMERARVKKMSIKETSGFELSLERETDHYSSSPSTEGHMAQTPSFLPHTPHTPHESEKKETKVEGKYVTSPMVGTFYPAPSPEDAPFVKVGDRVDENTVVCIIEAMKVMNEVKAGISGTIAEVCLESGYPVEFGTKILRII